MVYLSFLGSSFLAIESHGMIMNYIIPYCRELVQFWKKDEIEVDIYVNILIYMCINDY